MKDGRMIDLEQNLAWDHAFSLRSGDRALSDLVPSTVVLLHEFMDQLKVKSLEIYSHKVEAAGDKCGYAQTPWNQDSGQNGDPFITRAAGCSSPVHQRAPSLLLFFLFFRSLPDFLSSMCTPDLSSFFIWLYFRPLVLVAWALCFSLFSLVQEVLNVFTSCCCFICIIVKRYSE